GAVVAPGPPEPEHELVATLLAESEQRALERVCRILQILETGEDFATIYTALRAEAPATRAGARELIGHVLGGACRDGLLALTDTLPPPERLEAASGAISVPIARRTLEAWRISQAATPETDARALLMRIVEDLCADRNVVIASVARWAARSYVAAAPA